MRRSAEERRLAVLIALLGGSGTLHYTAPGLYEKIVPPQLGDARRLVLASGAAELACATALAVPWTRRIGALASAALFVAVFPANLYAVKVMGDRKAGRAAAIARLPLQVPMVIAALKIARED